MKQANPPMRIRETIPAAKIEQGIREMTKYLSEHFDFANDEVALIGIQTRGYALAKRMAEALEKEKNVEIQLGGLDITLYRDDIATSGIKAATGETRIDFDVDDKQIVLVDDVVFTGRTTRAALDEIMDFGRPRSVTLVTLIDRGHRELPIQPDFSAIKPATKKHESVILFVKEIDGKEEIIIGEAGE